MPDDAGWWAYIQAKDRTLEIVGPMKTQDEVFTRAVHKAFVSWDRASSITTGYGKLGPVFKPEVKLRQQWRDELEEINRVR